MPHLGLEMTYPIPHAWTIEIDGWFTIWGTSVLGDDGRNPHRAAHQRGDRHAWWGLVSARSG